MGSGCATIGGVVPSNTMGPQFRFYRQHFSEHISQLLLIRKDEKDTGNGHFLKKELSYSVSSVFALNYKGRFISTGTVILME